MKATRATLRAMMREATTPMTTGARRGFGPPAAAAAAAQGLSRKGALRHGLKERLTTTFKHYICLLGDEESDSAFVLAHTHTHTHTKLPCSLHRCGQQ